MEQNIQFWCGSLDMCMMPYTQLLTFDVPPQTPCSHIPQSSRISRADLFLCSNLPQLRYLGHLMGNPSENPGALGDVATVIVREGV